MNSTLKTTWLATILLTAGCTASYTPASLASARQRFIDSRARIGKSIEKADESTRFLDETLQSNSATPVTLRQQIGALVDASTRLEGDLQQYSARADRLEEECAATKARIEDEKHETLDPAIRRAEEVIESSTLPFCEAAVGEARRLIVRMQGSFQLTADLGHLAKVIDELGKTAGDSEALDKTKAELRTQSAAYGVKLASLRRAVNDLPANRKILSRSLWGH